MNSDMGPHALPTVEEVIRHRLSSALGGWRGSVETALPVVVFVAVWSWRHDTKAAVVGAVLVAVLLAGARLVQRGSLQHVGGAVFATALAAFFALRSGRAEDAFLPGIIGSAAWGTLTAASNLVRWPVVGLLVGAGDPDAREDPFRWRRDPALVLVCQRLTWVLVALYAVRVVVMYPLYLAGNVTWLGVTKLALGWPAWAVAIAIMGALLVRGRTPQRVETADSEVAWVEHHHPEDG
jgi:hypothetical protein